MKKKILIFIGEWKSEIWFFQEYIKRKCSVSWENIKSWISYKIWENFIIFAHPIIWNEKHKWWDCTFTSSKTYIDINSKIKSSEHMFWNLYECDFIYLFLTDKDKINSGEKIEWVDDLISEYCWNYNWKKEVIWAIKEIETWFLAWIWEEFIENYPEINQKNLEEFYKKNIENEDDTKEFLKNIILKNTKIWKSQEYIWREFWKYINIEKAKNKSDSFRNFVEKIEEILTI